MSDEQRVTSDDDKTLF